MKCRFCFSETHAKKDPMLTPCACSGSVKYVHRSCLQNWRDANRSNPSFNTCPVCRVDYTVIDAYKFPFSLINSMRCGVESIVYYIFMFIGSVFIEVSDPTQSIPTFLLKDLTPFIEILDNKFYYICFIYSFLICACTIFLYLLIICTIIYNRNSNKNIWLLLLWNMVTSLHFLCITSTILSNL